MKCACDWYQKEPLVHANRLQADFFKRTRPRLGQVLAPFVTIHPKLLPLNTWIFRNNNITLVPKTHTFGDASHQDFYGVEDLLKDPNVQPCVFKRDFRQWFASLNKTRMAIKQKRLHGFDIEDVYKKARYLDKVWLDWKFLSCLGNWWGLLGEIGVPPFWRSAQTILLQLYNAAERAGMSLLLLELYCQWQDALQEIYWFGWY